MDKSKKEKLVTMVQRLMDGYVKSVEEPSFAGFKVWVGKLLIEKEVRYGKIL